MYCGIKKPSRFLRIGAGLVVVATGVYLQSYWGVLGLVPIIFGVMDYCPMCSIKPALVKLISRT